MSSDQIRLREIDQEIHEARRHILLLSEWKRDEKRAHELSLKRMVLHRATLASNPALLTAIQPEVLRARLNR